MDQLHVYRDIRQRTNGEIYIGVVGPVRTGKSTFIKRFMDLMVIPEIEDEHQKKQMIDELPQSASGKMIMTTEPKFVPKEALNILISENLSVRIRLIDCVGFLVEGAQGHMEEEKERMVKTPWYEESIPFKKAAHIGTQKVIRDHSTIGLVITTDGSFGELKREQYIDAEKKAINELKVIGKPFLVIVNSARPYARQTIDICQEIEKTEGVKCLSFNCDQLKKEDIEKIMSSMLLEFPVSEIDFYTPAWFNLFELSHPLKTTIIEHVKGYLEQAQQLKDVRIKEAELICPYIKKCWIEEMDLSTGRVKMHLELNDQYYYERLSEMFDCDIPHDYALYQLIQKLSAQRNNYESIATAVASTKGTGYGLVKPDAAEILLQEPVLIRHGQRYGFKIKAVAPSIHLIKANIETEIAPIVGDEAQAEDLIASMSESYKKNPDEIWNTLIFGKTVGQLIEEGMQTKMMRMSEHYQVKMQEVLQKMINEGTGGVIFIII